jgi:hypothetical protein
VSIPHLPRGAGVPWTQVMRDVSSGSYSISRLDVKIEVSKHLEYSKILLNIDGIYRNRASSKLVNTKFLQNLTNS